MSGYVIKVMLENTHPPVWRRGSLARGEKSTCLFFGQEKIGKIMDTNSKKK